MRADHEISLSFIHSAGVVGAAVPAGMRCIRLRRVYFSAARLKNEFFRKGQVKKLIARQERTKWHALLHHSISSKGRIENMDGCVAVAARLIHKQRKYQASEKSALPDHFLSSTLRMRGVRSPASFASREMAEEKKEGRSMTTMKARMMCERLAADETAGVDAVEPSAQRNEYR